MGWSARGQGGRPRGLRWSMRCGLRPQDRGRVEQPTRSPRGARVRPRATMVASVLRRGRTTGGGQALRSSGPQTGTTASERGPAGHGGAGAALWSPGRQAQDGRRGRARWAGGPRSGPGSLRDGRTGSSVSGRLSCLGRGWRRGARAGGHPAQGRPAPPATGSGGRFPSLEGHSSRCSQVTAGRSAVLRREPVQSGCIPAWLSSPARSERG